MRDLGKIFGIGLSKTGTTSLSIALNRLGIETVDYPHDVDTLRELEHGQYGLSILRKYQAVTDISVAVYFAQLDRAFPGSKFILTVRDKESWLPSVEAHWKFTLKWANRNKTFRDFTYFIHAATYGSYTFNRDRYSYIYDQHVRNVKDYFRDRPEDLLVFDICGGEGYPKLCKFLGLPPLDEAFPAANTKQDKEGGRAWADRLDRALQKLRDVVEPGQTILLLDEGQLEGTEIMESWQAIPFPECNGEYAGRPPTGNQAAAMFEEVLKKQEKAHFVVAWPAFWWLEHYTELSNQLECFPRVAADQDLIVIDLRT